MPTAPPARSPAAWQGPLRAAVAIFAVGFLVVWLVKPIGNPCPYLANLPQDAAASSSPSFAPPGSRTCTYTVAAGAKVATHYMPWLDWIVLLLVAAVGAGVVRALSPAGRGERPDSARRRPRAAERAEGSVSKRSHASRFDRDPRPEGAQAEVQSRATADRDAAERERARQERAARRGR